MAREMTTQEQRYWEHMLSGDPLIGDFLKKQGMFVDTVKKALNQPICPKCERFAFYHGKGGCACPTCGYMGPVAQKVKTHLSEGWYK